jgi:hypothetical protein
MWLLELLADLLFFWPFSREGGDGDWKPLQGKAMSRKRRTGNRDSVR